MDEVLKMIGQRNFLRLLKVCLEDLNEKNTFRDYVLKKEKDTCIVVDEGLYNGIDIVKWKVKNSLKN